MFIYIQKINFFSNFFFLRYCKDILKICYLYFGWFGHALPHKTKMIVLIWGTFDFYLQTNNQLHPPCFSEDLLSAVCPTTQEQEFYQIFDSCWNINNLLAFILDYFQEKLMIKFFKKSKKRKKISGWGVGGGVVNFVLFRSIWSKMNFRWKEGKRALPVFKYSNYLPCQI